ncbi:MAG TPA: radical SAM protein, partial [Bdellovibrionales bacterium]|nr:radical SAM protein [Bdellovibrionales bacterium]
KVCDYIHLPFQAGNTEILRRMNRGYSREEYIAKVEMIQEVLPEVSLSTDIIVGFPGETEEQFMDTMTMLEKVPFETIFAFKYSPRPFTKAANFGSQVDEDVKSDRINRLFAHHKEISFKLVKKYEGRVLPVLVDKVDERDPKVVSGRTTQNKLVHFMGPADLVGKTVPVKILRAFPVNFRGELVAE